MNKRSSIEISLGAVIIVTGLAVELWAKQLYWITVYPPPLGKQILDALPSLLWVVGGALMADGLWRLLTFRRPLNLRFTSSLIFTGILTVCSLLYSKEVLWPDFYHINYGLPLPWLTRTLNTIAGPVDYFRVDPSMLVFDLIFWFAATSATLWSWSEIKTRRRSA